MRTNQDLFDYAKVLARIEVIDYDYRNLSGWYRDRRVRDLDRKQVMRRYGWMHETITAWAISQWQVDRN